MCWLDIYSLTKLFHDLLEFRVEVRCQISIDLRLKIGIGAFRKKQLLMQQPDLIIDFSDVFKLICVYSIILLS